MKKVVVVGAGIAGLSAAIYAQRNGFDVTLCEQHSIAGGMCTSWRRSGYLFEGAVHWLSGSNPATSLYQLWKETGALHDDVQVYYHEVFNSVDWEGQTIYLYRDIARTAEHMLAVSPKDKRRIRQLVSDVKAFSKLKMPVSDIKSVKSPNSRQVAFRTILQMIPLIGRFIRLHSMSCREYADQFKHPGLQRMFRVVPADDYSAVALIISLATLNTGDGGYPEGGSLGMISRMQKTFEDLGGKLLLNTPVKKVNIKDRAVTGITLENSILAADAVIVTQETIAALDNLFDVPLTDSWTKAIRKNARHEVCTFACVGIRGTIPEPALHAWTLNEPVTYAGITMREISFYSYGRYKGYAPEGCCALTSMLMGDTYDFWKQAQQEGRYEQEKQALADQLKRALCQKYPHLDGYIEVIDIATPLTYERYTGACHGSWMTKMYKKEKRKVYPGFLDSVSGLYFAGHRIKVPGGLPVALKSGRRAAQMVCRQFNIEFNSSAKTTSHRP